MGIDGCCQGFGSGTPLDADSVESVATDTERDVDFGVAALGMIEGDDPLIRGNRQDIGLLSPGGYTDDRISDEQ